MSNILITFGGEQYDITIRDMVERGKHLGADETWIYTDLWLTKRPFYTINRWLWDHHHKRGFGWYAWKPFVIIEALSRLYDDEDVVLFIDADTRPINDITVLFDECRRIGGIMLFRAETYQQRNWCKRDCYIVMGQDTPEYWDAPHAVARFMAFQKGKWNADQFLYEWQTYCVNPVAMTFDKSVLGPELDGFIEHRNEQAILTNLAHKYGCKLYREACEGGNGIDRDRDLYPQLFEQRNPNLEGGNKTLEVRGSKYGNV